MSDLDILREMIKDNAKVPLHDKHGKHYATLIEPQCPESNVTINGLPDDAIVIKADAFKSPDTVFNGEKGECKRADFIIVVNTDKKKVILFVEMKKSKKPEKEIIQQLAGAHCFAKYCSEIGVEFWETPNFLKGYALRFISIGHIGISKRPTKMNERKHIHDRPEKMLKISSPHYLEFNHLAGA